MTVRGDCGVAIVAACCSVISATDLRSLREDLTREGLFQHRTAASWMKLIALLGVFGVMVAAAVLLPWWCALLLVPLAALPAVTLAMIGHEAAHGSFAASRLHNEIVLHLIFPLFGGLGALHWKQKHNHRHHGHPNVAGKDPDIEIWPMALSSAAYEDSGPVRQWLQRRAQAYLFWPLTLFLSFVMRLESWKVIWARVAARRIDRALVMDAACLVAHYTLWLVVPSLVFGILPAIAFYVGLWAAGGLVLALIFAPAHMGMPVVSDHENPWMHQLQSTRNFLLPRWMSFFFVGLDHQVEHHLFPRIPHQHLPRASQIARAWCDRVGAPHNRIGYGAALVSVTRHLQDSWQAVPERAM